MPESFILTYREKNLINVLCHTSCFSYSEIESLFERLQVWDDVIAIMDRAQEQGMSLNDALMPLPVIIQP